MKDFTISTFKNLLETLLVQNYVFQTYSDLKINTLSKTIFLRHDVDLMPENSLITARIENELGIKGTYYFRIIPESFNKNIIKEIINLGHEIGYHYEDLSFANGDADKAYESFFRNLEAFRKLYPVRTICMHGSPLSKWDSRDIWKKYDFKNLNVDFEPYFDVDFSAVLYLTDTGRRWDGEKYSIRDKPLNKEIKNLNENYNFYSTFDIIKAADNKQLPNKIMITIHPQRWTNNYFQWTKELVLQNIKNFIKSFIVKRS